MSEFNLANLFADVFGIDTGKKYSPNFNTEGVEDGALKSSLGTTAMYPITLVGKKYKVNKQDGTVDYKAMNDFRLPLTCIVDFDRDKIMNSTPINNGAGGNVTESFGFANWQITIRGFCLEDIDQPQGLVTAKQQEEHLQEWEQLVDAIDVECELFAIRNITAMIITKIPMPSLRGKPGVRPFVIHAYGDEDLDLIL